jgi:hypothetical protein
MWPFPSTCQYMVGSLSERMKKLIGTCELAGTFLREIRIVIYSRFHIDMIANLSIRNRGRPIRRLQGQENFIPNRGIFEESLIEFRCGVVLRWVRALVFIELRCDSVKPLSLRLKVSPPHVCITSRSEGDVKAMNTRYCAYSLRN